MCTEINARLSILERRVAATEAAVTIPESTRGDGGGGRGSAGGRGLTVGEAVRANEEVRVVDVDAVFI